MAQKKKGGFFSSLGKAFDSVATSVDKAARGVSKDIVNTVGSPLDNLKVGYIISLTSRATNNLLKVASNGAVECSGVSKQKPDLDCQFEVLPPTGGQPRAIRLRSVAYPQFFLAILNGYFIGYGQGGPECDFMPHTYSDTNSPTIAPWCVFESVLTPGSHVGVIPTGQFSAPAQTPKSTNAAHFKVVFVGNAQTTDQSKSQPQASYPPPQTQPQAQPYPPGQGQPQAQPYPPGQGQPQAQPYPPGQGQPQAQPYPPGQGQPQAQPYPPGQGQPQAQPYPYPPPPSSQDPAPSAPPPS